MISGVLISVVNLPPIPVEGEFIAAPVKMLLETWRQDP
jgi:hypothetical protein